MVALTARWRRALTGLGLMAAVLAAPPRGRAAPLSELRFNGTWYVSMIEVCGRLGLRFEASDSGRSLTVENALHRAVLLPSARVNAREMHLDGVRVFLGDPIEERAGRFFVSVTDYGNRLLPLFRPDLIRPRVRPPRLIVLDPGHGGIDPGARNLRFGLEEKRLTLDVAFRLKRILESEGWQVVLTRSTDTQLSTNKFVDLPMRSDLANRLHADLFLSLHFDADADPRVRGSEILTFAPMGQRSSDAWGRRDDDHLDQPSIGDRWVGWSNVFAHCLFRELLPTLHTEDLGERIRHLAVLRYLNCPGALVEPVFISNDAEAARAADPAFRERVAVGLADGIRNYAGLVSRLGR